MSTERILPALKGLVENSLIEWPGKISIVVFLAGCNFRCPFCHSRSLVTGAETGEEVPFEAVEKILADHDQWVDGVVISGGEPAIAAELAELLRRIKAAGVGTRLNTNGSRPDVLKSLAAEGLLDSVALDVKAPLNEKYAALAGVDVDLGAIEESIDWLLAGGVGDVEFRTTVVPELLCDDDIIAIARRLGPKAAYVLQPFRPLDCLDEECNSLPAVSGSSLVGLAARAGEFTASCLVRGMESQTAR